MGHARPRQTAGRQDLTGKQRPSPGRQRPSPTRVPTYTSRRVGSGQGDLPHTRESTSASRMHGNHKEQHLSQSLNRWKERPALRHRHAGMLTGSEPYTLKGILSKWVWVLMTRLSPSLREDLGHIRPTSNIKVSEVFSLYTLHTAFYQCYEFNVTMCSIEKRTNLWLGQWPNVTNTMCSIERKTIPSNRTVGLIFHIVFYQYDSVAKCSIERRTVPINRAVALMLIVHIIWLHEGDNLPLLWYIGNVNLIKFWKESKDSKESAKCSVKFFIPIPIPWDQSHSGDAQSIPYCPIHCIPFRRLPYRPEGLPYGQGTAPTVPQNTLASGTDIPMVPSINSLQEAPRGHTDYKTA